MVFGKSSKLSGHQFSYLYRIFILERLEIQIPLKAKMKGKRKTWIIVKLIFFFKFPAFVSEVFLTAQGGLHSLDTKNQPIIKSFSLERLLSHLLGSVDSLHLSSLSLGSIEKQVIGKGTIICLSLVEAKLEEVTLKWDSNEPATFWNRLLQGHRVFRGDTHTQDPPPTGWGIDWRRKRPNSLCIRPLAINSIRSGSLWPPFRTQCLNLPLIKWS